MASMSWRSPRGRRYGEDELRYTRERIAGKYTACQLLYWYRSNEMWKMSERNSSQARLNTQTLENPQGMRQPAKEPIPYTTKRQGRGHRKAA
jgi:hypothetical protein